jgi:hypothetical protein
VNRPRSPAPTPSTRPRSARIFSTPATSCSAPRRSRTASSTRDRQTASARLSIWRSRRRARCCRTRSRATSRRFRATTALSARSWSRPAPRRTSSTTQRWHPASARAPAYSLRAAVSAGGSRSSPTARAPSSASRPARRAGSATRAHRWHRTCCAWGCSSAETPPGSAATSAASVRAAHALLSATCRASPATAHGGSCSQRRTPARAQASRGCRSGSWPHAGRRSSR